MNSEEQEMLNAKWAIVQCPWDKVRGTNIPRNIISILYDTKQEAEAEFNMRFPNKKWNDYEHGIFQTDGTTIFVM